MKKTSKNIVLKTSNLTIGYKSKKEESVIASNINIELNKGELVGLIGANGIGKSTLLRTLTKVQPSLSGKVQINSKDLNKLSNIELAKALSLVLTEHITSKNLSVTEIVALGRQPYTNWIGTLSPKDKDVVNTAISKASIEDIIDKKCYELSDGQLQKVMIARALAQDTDLIILDEPTTHLDMYHKAYILNLLKSLASDTNKTILFSSHEIDLAIQLCDKLVVMTESSIIVDSPKNLINQGAFEKLFPKDLIVFDSKTESFRVNK